MDSLLFKLIEEEQLIENIRDEKRLFGEKWRNPKEKATQLLQLSRHGKDRELQGYRYLRTLENS